MTKTPHPSVDWEAASRQALRVLHRECDGIPVNGSSLAPCAAGNSDRNKWVVSRAVGY